jgi:DnaK suppressor protein
MLDNPDFRKCRNYRQNQSFLELRNSRATRLIPEIVYMAVKKKAAKPKATAKKKSTVKKPVAKKTASQSATAKKASDGKASKKAAPVKKSAPASKPVAKKKTAPAKSKTASSKSKVGPVPGIASYHETKGEEYMNEDQVAHFRNILLTWKKELMEEVDRTVHHMQDDAANFPDPNDRATQESEFSMELRARDRERKLIKKIDEALTHLDENEYGYCEACGVEIGVKRLEARPTATLCIDCKILDEIREKQMG